MKKANNNNKPSSSQNEITNFFRRSVGGAAAKKEEEGLPGPPQSGGSASSAAKTSLDHLQKDVPSPSPLPLPLPNPSPSLNSYSSSSSSTKVFSEIIRPKIAIPPPHPPQLPPPMSLPLPLPREIERREEQAQKEDIIIIPTSNEMEEEDLSFPSVVSENVISNSESNGPSLEVKASHVALTEAEEDDWDELVVYTAASGRNIPITIPTKTNTEMKHDPLKLPPPPRSSSPTSSIHTMTLDSKPSNLVLFESTPPTIFQSLGTEAGTGTGGSDSESDDFMADIRTFKKPKLENESSTASFKKPPVDDLMKSKLSELGNLLKAGSKIIKKNQNYEDMDRILNAAGAAEVEESEELMKARKILDDAEVEHETVYVKKFKMLDAPMGAFSELSYFFPTFISCVYNVESAVYYIFTGLVDDCKNTNTKWNAAAMRNLYKNGPLLGTTENFATMCAAGIAAAMAFVPPLLTEDDICESFIQAGIPRFIFFDDEPYKPYSSCIFQSAEMKASNVPAALTPNHQLSVCLKLFESLQFLNFPPLKLDRFLVMLSLLAMDEQGELYLDLIYNCIVKIIQIIPDSNWELVGKAWFRKLAFYIGPDQLIGSRLVIEFLDGCKSMYDCGKLIIWSRLAAFSLFLDVCDSSHREAVPDIEYESTSVRNLKKIIAVLEQSPLFSKNVQSYSTTLYALNLLRHELPPSTIIAAQVSSGKLSDFLLKFHNSIDDRMALYLERTLVKDEVLRIKMVIDLLK